MPDFRRWVLQASEEFSAQKPGDFIWSPAGHFLFRRCRRAWFCKHILAQGGWDIYSHEFALHAYLLKYLDTADSWTSRIVEGSLAEALLKIANEREDRTALLLEEWQISVSQHWIRARDELIREDYLSDPKKTSFLELHYAEDGFPSPLSLMNKIREHLSLFFRLVESSEIPAELATFDSLAWRIPPQLNTFTQYGLKIALRPWLYAIRKKTLQAWTFSFDMGNASSATEFPDPDDEENGLSERILALWCALRYPVYQPVVHKVHLTSDGLIRRKIAPIPVSEEFLRESSVPMLRLLNDRNGLRMSSFPTAPDPAQCLACRFRSLCENLPEEEDNLSSDDTGSESL